MEFVSWDDDIPNILWKHIIQMLQTTNQLMNGAVASIQCTKQHLLGTA